LKLTFNQLIFHWLLEQPSLGLVTSILWNWSASELSVFLENDSTDLCQFFSGLGKKLVRINLHWKTLHPAFKPYSAFWSCWR